MNRPYERFHKNTRRQKKIVSLNNFTYGVILRVINKYPPKKANVLDIECGAGTLAFYFASEGNSVLGIDISSNAIKACQDSVKSMNLSNIRFKVMNFPKQTPREKFDYIICTEVIEHIKDDTLALKKIFELINNNGIAFISTPSKNAPLHRLGLARDFDKRVGHLRRYTMEELVEKVQKLGFQVIYKEKTESIVRNFLFLNPIAGRFVRFIKNFMSDVITYIDILSLKLFGEPDLILIVTKT